MKQFVKSTSAITKMYAIILSVIIVVSCVAVIAYMLWPKPVEKIHLTFYTHWAGETDSRPWFWEPAIEYYESIHPNIEIEMIYETASFWQKFLTLYTAGTGPDMIMAGGGGTPDWIKNGMLDQPSAAIVADIKARQWPGAVTAAEIANYGGDWGYIAEYSSNCLIYNKDLTDAAGITIPETGLQWNDLIAAAQKLTKRDASGKIIQEGLNFDSLWFANCLLLTNGGATFERNTNGDPIRATYNSTEGVEVMTEMLKCYYEYGVSSREFQQSIDFPAGRTAMILAGTYVFNNLRRSATPDLLARFPFRVVCAPYFKVQANWVWTWHMFVTSICKHKEEAWKFIQFLHTPQKGAYSLPQAGTAGDLPAGSVQGTPFGKYCIFGYGIMSPTMSDTDDEAAGFQIAPYGTYLSGLQTLMTSRAVTEPYFAGYQEIYSPWEQILDKILNKELTPKEALDQAAAASDRLIAEIYG